MALFKQVSLEDNEEEITGTLTPEDVVDHAEAHEDVASEIEEIQDTFSAIDDAEEVKQDLEEKVVALEALAADELTMYHVNDAKKTYTNACKRLGLDPVAISTEDIDNGVKLSVESMKDVIIKIIEAIKAVIAKIVLGVRKLYIKVEVAFNNDIKVITKLGNEIESKLANKSDTHVVELKNFFTSNVTFQNELFKKLSAMFYLGEKHNGLDVLAALEYAAKQYASSKEIITGGLNHNGVFGVIPAAINGWGGKQTWQEMLSEITRNYPGKFAFKEWNEYDKDGKDPEKVAVISTKANVLNVIMMYSTKIDDVEAYDYEYKHLTIKGAAAGEQDKLGMVRVISELNSPTIKRFIAIVRELSSAIVKNKDAMFKELSEIDSKVKDSEKMLSDNATSDALLKYNLGVVRKFASILPKAYVDRMAAILYLNKTCITILHSANSALKA